MDCRMPSVAIAVALALAGTSSLVAPGSARAAEVWWEADYGEVDLESPIYAEVGYDPYALYTNRWWEEERAFEPGKGDLAEPPRPRATTDAPAPAADDLGGGFDRSVRVGYDLDGDGEFDAFERLDVEELERIRATARVRPAPPRAAALADPFAEPEPRRGLGGDDAERDTPPLRIYEGRIEDVERVDVHGRGDRHVVATLETNGGRRAKVDLGSWRDLDARGIGREDRVRVAGFPGTLDGRPHLLATHVVHDGDTLRVERPVNPGLFAVRGEVLDAETRTIDDREQVVLKLRPEGRARTPFIVLLGPAPRVTGIPERGDEVHILGHASRRGSTGFVVAHEVYADGRLVTTDRFESPARLDDDDPRRDEQATTGKRRPGSVRESIGENGREGLSAPHERMKREGSWDDLAPRP